MTLMALMALMQHLGESWYSFSDHRHLKKKSRARVRTHTEQKVHPSPGWTAGTFSK